MCGDSNYNRSSRKRGNDVANAESFRQAWSMFPTGVAVLTTIESNGHVHGMAANGINSVSLDPLLVLACVGHSRNSYSLVKEARRFAINILREDQQDIAEYYARPPEQRRGEAGASFSFTERGAAVLDGCLVSMDCHVVAEHVAGDHTIFIGEVDEIRSNPGKPLVFCEGEYSRLG